MFNLTEFFKALSNDTRLRIIALLFQKEMCVCEICDVIEESQPKVSRHLAKLRNTNLVRDERESQWVFYHLNIENKTVSEIMSAIIKNIDDHPQLSNDKKRLSEKLKQGKLCEREDK